MATPQDGMRVPPQDDMHVQDDRELLLKAVSLFDFGGVFCK